jgi:hypothetical protein
LESKFCAIFSLNFDRLLAASFEEVTNSYKFYWFLAILESVRENEGRIFTLDSLLARMIASV